VENNIISILPEGEELSATLTPSEYYNLKVFYHLQAAYPQRSIVADPVGCLPCPGSWP